MSDEKQKNKVWFVEHYRIERSLEYVRQYNPESSWQKLSIVLERKRKTRRIVYFSSAAAVVALFVVSAYFWLSLGNSKESPLVRPQIAQVEKSQEQGVVLALANGRRIDLSMEKLPLDENVKNDAQNKQLSYEQISSQQDSLEWNTLEVPRGMDYQLLLSDGTRVWLNARSRLTYPKVFGELREVKLEGEAYFDVERDGKRPFVVQTGQVVVRVLGTEFNVNTYSPEKVKTVLVEGKVELENAGGSKITLKPGELVETVGTQFRRVQVNVRKYISWKEGEFYFEEASLGEIMRELSDWYGVQPVFTTTSLRNRKFSGVLKRDTSIVEVLKKIERTTSVTFEIRDKIVSIK